MADEKSKAALRNANQDPPLLDLSDTLQGDIERLRETIGRINTALHQVGRVSLEVQDALLGVQTRQVELRMKLKAREESA